MVELDELPSFEKMRKPKDRNHGFGDGYVYGRNFQRKSCSIKRRFPDNEAAKQARSHLKKVCMRDHKIYDKLEIYHCPNCGGYHFTNRLKVHEKVPVV